MPAFRTKMLPAQRDAVAPDGSDVRVLLQLAGGSLAHFELAEGATSVAVRHRTIEEIWFVIGGRGEMWRRLDGEAAIDELTAGTCITLPVSTEFQFRSLGPGPFQAIGVTMPPWPGSDEAVVVSGHWKPTVASGPL